MTLANPNSEIAYLGNGTTRVFPFPFPVLDADHLQVTVTRNDTTPPLVEPLSPTLFGVTGIGAANGGSVIYPLPSSPPLPATSTILIRRIVPLAQEVNLTNQGAIYPEVLEGALDRLTMAVQQVNAETERAVKVPLGSGIDPDQYWTILNDAAEAAGASATEASTSATSAENSATQAETSATAAANSASEADDLSRVVGASANYALQQYQAAYQASTAATAAATSAALSEAAASHSKTQAADAAENAATSETESSSWANQALLSSVSSASSATAAANSATQAVTSATAAASSATLAQQAATSAMGSVAFTTGGTASALTLTPTPALMSLQVGKIFDITFHGAMSPPATLAVSGLAAKPLKCRGLNGQKWDGASNTIPTGWTTSVCYDGTDWVLRDVPNTNDPVLPTSREIFSARVSTNHTWVKPAGYKHSTVVVVECIGGGGSGACGSVGAGGGGSGGYSRKEFFLAQLPASVEVFVSASPTGTNVTNTNGTRGGTSYFGDLVYAHGGDGGKVFDGVSFDRLANWDLEHTGLGGCPGQNTGFNRRIVNSITAFNGGNGGWFYQDGATIHPENGAASAFGGGGGASFLNGYTVTGSSDLYSYSGGRGEFCGGHGGDVSNFQQMRSGDSPGGGGSGSGPGQMSGSGGRGLVIVTIYDGLPTYTESILIP
ncbi:MAG: hypothetical protein HQM01_04960 [Magnetococcales bacterium]|nr:hypothetical protein [Magnetococcales bacterium]